MNYSLWMADRTSTAVHHPLRMSIHLSEAFEQDIAQGSVMSSIPHTSDSLAMVFERAGEEGESPLVATMLSRNHRTGDPS